MCPFILPPGGYPDGIPPFLYYLTHPSTVRRSNRCGTPRELHVDLVGQLQDVASSVIAFRKSISCRMIGAHPEGWCMWLCLLFFPPGGYPDGSLQIVLFMHKAGTPPLPHSYRPWRTRRRRPCHVQCIGCGSCGEERREVKRRRVKAR